MTTARLSLLTVIAALSVGCAGAPSPEVPNAGVPKLGASASQPLLVSLRAERAQRGGEPRPLLAEDRIKTGERYAFRVTPTHEAYVLLVQYDIDGSAAVIFPARDPARRIPANQETRIPLPGQWLEVEGPPGKENIFVIVSEASLDPPDPRSLVVPSDQRTPRTETTAPPAPGPTPPPASSPTPRPSMTPLPPPASGSSSSPKVSHLSSAIKPVSNLFAGGMPGLITRSTKLVGDAGSYQAQADAQGVVVLHFALNHVE